MKKTTTSGDNIRENMQVDFNQEAVGKIGSDNAAIDAAISSLSNYRNMTFGVLDEMDSADNPFDTPAEATAKKPETSPEATIAKVPFTDGDEANSLSSAVAAPEIVIVEEIADQDTLNAFRDEDDIFADIPESSPVTSGNDLPTSIDESPFSDIPESVPLAPVADAESAESDVIGQDDSVFGEDHVEQEAQETIETERSDSLSSILDEDMNRLQMEQRALSRPQDDDRKAPKEPLVVDDSFGNLSDLADSVSDDDGEEDIIGSFFSGGKASVPSGRAADDISDSFEGFLNSPPSQATKKETPAVRDGFSDFSSLLDTEESDVGTKSWKTPEPSPEQDNDFGLSEYDSVNPEIENEIASITSAATVAEEKAAQKVKPVEVRRSPEVPEGMPEGWVVGQEDPDSAAAAVFSSGEDAADTETSDTETIENVAGKPDKRGKRMFGKKKAKEVETAVAVDDTVPEKKSGKKKLLLLSTAAVIVIGALGLGGFVMMDQPTETRPRITQPLPVTKDLPPVNAADDKLGLPGDAAKDGPADNTGNTPAETGKLGLPGDDSPKDPVAVKDQGDKSSQDDGKAVTPVIQPSDNPNDVSVSPDDGDGAFIDGAGVLSSERVAAEVRADVDRLSIENEKQNEEISELKDLVRQMSEAVQLRDASLEAQDGKIKEAIGVASEARRIADDQNDILVQFAHTQAVVDQNTNMAVDLSGRVVGLETESSRVDDLAKEVARMRRDISAIARLSIQGNAGGREIELPSAPKVAPAPSSGAVYDGGSVPLDLPQQVQVPADVKIGDDIPGGGKVIDIVTQSDTSRRLVIMEKAQVVIDAAQPSN